MTVMELNRDQLTELKQRMVDDEISETEGRSASYGELANAESIPDEKVFERYDGVEFVEEDFFLLVDEQASMGIREVEIE